MRQRLLSALLGLIWLPVIALGQAQVAGWIFTDGQQAGAAFTEVDPTVPAAVKAITATDTNKWTAASSTSNGLDAVLTISENAGGRNGTNFGNLQANGTVAASGGSSPNWNAAYSWGNHATNGYLKTATDDYARAVGAYGSNTAYAVSNSWFGSVAYRISLTDTSAWYQAYDWVVAYGGTVATTNYVTNYVIQALSPYAAKSNDWTTAFGWGNHATNGYLKSATDDYARAVGAYGSNTAYAVSNSWFGSVAYRITLTDTSNWTTAYNWVMQYGGTLVDTNYLTNALTQALAPYAAKSNDWTTAYGWGNHATNGYLKSATDDVARAWATYGSNTAYAVSNSWFQSAAFGITAGNSNNWQSAYTWSMNDPVQDTNVAQAVMALYPTGNWNTAYSWGNHATNSYIKDGGTTSNGIFATRTSGWAGNELITADGARSFLSGGTFLYATTNVHPVNTNFYTYNSTTQTVGAARTYPAVTNNQYIGVVMSTQRYTTVYSPVLVNAYLGFNTGGGRTVTVKPEIYYSYDGTNELGDYDCGGQAIVGSGSNLMSFAISFPTIEATNSTGVYVIRKFKVVNQTVNPNVSIYVGGATPSHLSFTIPPTVDPSLGVRGATGVVVTACSAISGWTYDTTLRMFTFTGPSVMQLGTWQTSSNLVFSAAATNSFYLPAITNQVSCLRGGVYNVSTNIFSKTMALGWYENADYKGTNLYWLANVSLVASPLTASEVIGSYTCVVADATGFLTNDLVYFQTTATKARIAAINGNILTFTDTLTANHSAPEGVSRIAEFGGFGLWNNAGVAALYGRLVATNAVTCTNKLEMLYKE